MKKTLKGLFVSALMVLICLSLVACSHGGDSELPSLSIKSPFSDEYPKNIANTLKVNGSMDALTMYKVGVRNFNEVQFVASRQIGNIFTKSGIGKTIPQTIDSLKIKDNDRYYLETTSFSTEKLPVVNEYIKIADQSIYENGKYRVRSATSKGMYVKDDNLFVGKWPETENFASLSAGLAKYPNDPTRINMFIVDKSTIVKSTKPEFDAKTKTYKFNFELNIDTATKDYLKNMVYNTKKGGISSATEKDITFTKLNLSVTMWDNGLIKEIASEEAYEVSYFGTNKTSLQSITFFTYDNKEVDVNKYFGQF